MDGLSSQIDHIPNDHGVTDRIPACKERSMIMLIHSLAKSCYAFMPDEVKVLGDAFDDAMTALHVDKCDDDQMASLVAMQIIELAKCGERDPERLRSVALESLGLDPLGRDCCVFGFERKRT